MISASTSCTPQPTLALDIAAEQGGRERAP
jgi:hypothetical protein